ncbi:MAG: ABC transporter permease [Candidatus Sumerlaeaceae bacterium]
MLRVAFRALRAHKLRALLTTLGIIIGVASVIAMLALGAGTREKITAQVRSFGANLLSVRAAQRGGSSGVRTGMQQNLIPEDAEAILAQVPEVVAVTPDLDGDAQVKYMNKNCKTEVNGEAPTYFDIRSFPIAHGRIFTDADVERASRVAVLGNKPATDLFGADLDLAVGETIKVKGINFTVVGVAKPKDEYSDDNIWIPYTTAMHQVLGQDHLDQIYCKVRDGVDMAQAQASVEAVLRKRHRIQPGAEDDFTVRNLQAAVDSLNDVSRVFTLLLSGVAGISLLVGGVNIMNIMLVTVTERTREIGVRKALGARDRDLLGQFLLEALTLSTLGGVVGIAVGVGAVVLFNQITQHVNGEAFGAPIQLAPLLLAFFTSVLVGITSGWYPALRAARLHPIDALRYE